MSRGNYPAFPIPHFQRQDGELQWGDFGLTIREHFAGLAMQAILTGAVTRGCPGHEWTDQQMSMKVADALIAELEKPAAPNLDVVRAERRAAWEAITAHIQIGELPNNCDTWQRNGVILAANVLRERLDQVQP